MKEVLYYVLKYEDKYYAPYMNHYGTFSFLLDNILSTNRKLAARFGDKETALYMKKREVYYRSMYGSNFDQNKCRIVRVVRKEHKERHAK